VNSVFESRIAMEAEALPTADATVPGRTAWGNSSPANSWLPSPAAIPVALSGYCARITRVEGVGASESCCNQPTARARILGEFTPKCDTSRPGVLRLTTTRTAL
jgi:hypothetical protein